MAEIRLEPLSRSHLEGVAAMLEDPGVQRFTRIPVPPPAGYEGTWLGRYEEGHRDGTREGFAIVDAADDSFLGLALAPTIDREKRTVELGYVVGPWARGRGVATEALRQLTGWAFDTLDPVRIELWISVDNDASKRVAQKCGYSYEGTLRSMHFKQDIWEDGEIWSRVATDPELPASR